LNKICLINHFAGIGDVFFLQYVARKYMAMGYHVIWPLKNEILWIKDYIPDIQFCSIDDNFPGKEHYGQDIIIQSPQFVYLGINRSHLWGNDYQLGSNTCVIMQSKYELVGLNWNNWISGFKYQRNIDKENSLYYNVLGLNDNSNYVFINRYANTENRKNDKVIFPDFNIPVIENKIIEGFTLFDWSKVIENAQEIHTVHTAINYLVETLNIKAKKYIMHQGIHSDDIKNIPFNIHNPTYIQTK
tara:strand:- start:7490 stop:8221 length:732 start_codon:yes stop_codon:yes gene_type:complete